MGRLLSVPLHPGRLAELFSHETISQVWLQHPERNGHPPLNELWMALAGAPFHWAGASDLQAFRIAVTMLLAGAAALLFLLLRTRFSRPAALAGAVAYLGIPVVWAHGHFGATEAIQNLFWVLLALLLPKALADTRPRHPWVWAWLFAAALSFMAKFTNVLIPFWVLGTAGVLGAWRSRRFWLCAGLGIVAAPLLLMVLDPFFWPWQGGIARFGDYLRQTTTRAQWVPINVFYAGRMWGFHAPWHYRPVMTAVTLPAPVLLLAATGLFLAARAFAERLAAVWLPGRSAAGTGTPHSSAGAGASRDPLLAAWPQALAVTGLVYTFLVGILPSTPNHDGVRQFVFVYVPVALLAGTGAEGLFRLLQRRLPAFLRDARIAAGTVLLLAAWALAISVTFEPWGLSYYGPLVGGSRGAWRRGFELTYWVESLTPRLLSQLGSIPSRDGGPLRVLTIPKLNFFADAEPFVRPLLPGPLAARTPVALDDYSAFYSKWAEPHRRGERGAVLGLSFLSPPDAILISYRRATVSQPLWDFMDALARRGELTLLAEDGCDGVPLARLYRVHELRTSKLPEDPERRTWYQLPTVAALQKKMDERAGVPPQK